MSQLCHLEHVLFMVEVKIKNKIRLYSNDKWNDDSLKKIIGLLLK